MILWIEALLLTINAPPQAPLLYWMLCFYPFATGLVEFVRECTQDVKEHVPGLGQQIEAAVDNVRYNTNSR